MRSRRTSPLLGFLAFGLLAALVAALAPRPAESAGPAPALPPIPARRCPWLAWGLVAGALIAAATGVLGYRAWATAAELDAVASAMTRGEPRRAADPMTRYGCGGCHTIPGLPGADGLVAAPLSNLRARVFVGGGLRNTPDNLVRWIVDPQAFSARSAMPRTGITEAEARDVAAYLYAH